MRFVALEDRTNGRHRYLRLALRLGPALSHDFVDAGEERQHRDHVIGDEPIRAPSPSGWVEAAVARSELKVTSVAIAPSVADA